MDALEKKFRYLNDKGHPVTSTNWKLYQSIFTDIQKGIVPIISIECNRTYYSDEELKAKLLYVSQDPKRPNLIWSTYDGCTFLTFIVSANGKGIRIDIQVYDGNNVYGTKTQFRFAIAVEVPMNYISVIENTISDEFSDLMEEEYDDYLEKQKQDWIEERTNIIIE